MNGIGAIFAIKEQIRLLNLDNLVIVIISHREIKDIYKDKIEGVLSGEYKDIKWILIPSGEKNKTMETVEYLYSELARLEVTKNTPVIALGGGVLQDGIGGKV